MRIRVGMGRIRAGRPIGRQGLAPINAARTVQQHWLVSRCAAGVRNWAALSTEFRRYQWRLRFLTIIHFGMRKSTNLRYRMI